MTPQKPRVRVKAGSVPVAFESKPVARSAYMRGNSGPVFTGWNPALRETRDEIRAAWRPAAARAVDMIQNSGFIAGIIEQSSANVVGAGLRLNAKPNAAGLNITADEAGALAREIEARFNIYTASAYECDAENRRAFGHQQVAAYRHWMAFGEIVASFPWQKRPGARHGTKVRLIPAHRLSQESDPLRNKRHGVWLDSSDAPVRYDFKEVTPAGIERLRTVDARDMFGRPQVAHVFDAPLGAVRGITPLAPVLRVTRQFDQLADATLTSAIISAVFAATIETTEPTTDVLRALQTPEEQARGDSSLIDSWFDAREGWYDNTQIDLGINGRFAHLFPGQKLSFHATQAPTADYEKFAMFLMREIARCAGLTVESATGDYRSATYSSIRMGSADIFPITVQRRKHLVAPFCQAAYECWLEEEISSGGLAFPGGIDGFYANRTAACMAEWRGAGKPQADDVKTAKAHETWKRLGVMTDEMICSDLGVDVEDVYDGRAREAKMRQERGLPDFDASSQSVISDGDVADEAETAPNKGKADA